MKRQDGCLTAIVIATIIAIIVAVYYYQLSGSWLVSIFIISPAIILILTVLPIVIIRRKAIKQQELEVRTKNLYKES